MGLGSVVDDVLSRDIPLIDELLSEKDRLREETIRIARDILRYSTEATRLIHLERYDEAWENLIKAGGLAGKIRELLKDHPDLYYSGLVYNSLSEYVEALITYKLIVEKKMPPYSGLDIPYVPYLQGLGDVVGELRRHILSLLNRGEIGSATEYLEVMETIYLWLRKLNYPDPLVPGLRHKVDVARRLIDDTKTLIINTRNAHLIDKKLEEFMEKLRLHNICS